jgi:hypothetical protein
MRATGISEGCVGDRSNARSTLPLVSIRNTSPWSSDWRTRTANCGCRDWNPVSIGTRMYWMMSDVAMTRSSAPPDGDRTASSSAENSSRLRIDRSQNSSSASPAGVSVTPTPECLSKIGIPSMRSIWRTRWDIAGWVKQRSLLASWNEPVPTIVRTVCNWSKVRLYTSCCDVERGGIGSVAPPVGKLHLTWERNIPLVRRCKTSSRTRSRSWGQG